MTTLVEPSYFVHAPLGHSISYKSIDTSCKIESYIFVVKSNDEEAKISNRKKSSNPKWKMQTYANGKHGTLDIQELWSGA